MVNFPGQLAPLVLETDPFMTLLDIGILGLQSSQTI